MNSCIFKHFEASEVAMIKEKGQRHINSYLEEIIFGSRVSD